MNRKVTPVLIALVLVLGAAALLTRHQRQGEPAAAGARGARLLALEASALQAVRVQRDFWNTFALTRQRDGVWRLTEPADEEAAPDAARRLLDQLVDLPALATIDLPSDDTERYREYGLWRPEIEVTVTTADDRHVLLVGSPTPDGAGHYAAVVGRDEVHTIPAAAVEVLGAELAGYRAAAHTGAGDSAAEGGG